MKGGRQAGAGHAELPGYTCAGTYMLVSRVCAGAGPQAASPPYPASVCRITTTGNILEMGLHGLLFYLPGRFHFQLPGGVYKCVC